MECQKDRLGAKFLPMQIVFMGINPQIPSCTALLFIKWYAVTNLEIYHMKVMDALQTVYGIEIKFIRYMTSELFK